MERQKLRREGSYLSYMNTNNQAPTTASMASRLTKSASDRVVPLAFATKAKTSSHNPCPQLGSLPHGVGSTRPN